MKRCAAYYDSDAAYSESCGQPCHFYKVRLSTLFPKRNATFHGVFLLRLSVDMQ